jgi:hypothetical protein
MYLHRLRGGFFGKNFQFDLHNITKVMICRILKVCDTQNFFHLLTSSANDEDINSADDQPPGVSGTGYNIKTNKKENIE